jgi:hypothetical protein
MDAPSEYERSLLSLAQEESSEKESSPAEEDSDGPMLLVRVLVPVTV